MDVFRLRRRLVDDYGSYVSSFIRIKDDRVEEVVLNGLAQGLLWPDPLIQLNPSLEAGETIDELVGEGTLHEECARVFRRNKKPHDPGDDLRLHRHQADAIRTASEGHNYVLTTGTGSGKSLAYIVPVVDRATEERFTYAPQPPDTPDLRSEEGANGAAEPASREETSLPSDAPEHHAPGEPEDATHDGPYAPVAPNTYTAALALHACVPDGEKVERDTLLVAAARELGHPKLTKKVRRALNKALNAEHNARRLKTDWDKVWRPRKR